MTSAVKRRNIADTIDQLDREIADLQESKRETYASYREGLKAEGLRDTEIKAEIEAMKKAIARRRKLIAAPAEVDEMDAKVDEIVSDLMAKPLSGTALATRARHARADAFDAETGELLGDAPAASPESLGPLRTQEEQPSPSEPRSLTDESPSAFSSSACANPAAGQEVTGQSGMTATTPYRIAPRTPEPAAPDPDASPLIVDAGLRMAAAARKLAELQGAAE